MANNDSRSARINGATNPKADKNVFLEYQNNVNFNWGRRNSCYGGENEAGEGSTHECNFVGNYYKPGPAHPDDNCLIEISSARKGKTLTGPSVWYFSDNVMEGQKTKDNWQYISKIRGPSLAVPGGYSLENSTRCDFIRHILYCIMAMGVAEGPIPCTRCPGRNLTLYIVRIIGIFED